MRLRFDPNQPHQLRALAAVLDALQGQPSVPAHDCVRGDGVVANRLIVDRDVLLHDVAKVQRAAGLPVDEVLADLDVPADRDRSGPAGPNLSVEMETGTGKTYTYLRTAFELARHHGLRKIVIVVPGVAVREAVLKTLQLTREHFAALYPDVPYRFFAYDAARVGLVDAFARSGRLEMMIVTVDAFNKSKNVLRQPHDRFGGDTPLRRLASTRPVVILDEPHNFESELRREALADLEPLLVLRYGATHRKRYSLLHRLSPREAQVLGLVKRVEVLEVDTRDMSGDAAMSTRLGALVQTHLQRQAALRSRGIKVLSLVFIDRVDAYVGGDAPIARAFDHHFESFAHLDPGCTGLRPEQVRAAYFAERRVRGGAVPIDSRTGSSAADEQAYALIMRDKERLLSLHEPVSFIFSHSALREGWDNPNIFQICTLARARSAIRKRQEIGRGIRLCVDQSGRRVRDPAIDVLRIIAHESYDDYVATLTDELADADPAQRPTPPARAERQCAKLDPDRALPPRARDVPPIGDDLVEQIVIRVRARWTTQEPRGTGGAATQLPPLVDLVILGLQRRAPNMPIRRGTILAILERLEAPQWLIAQPHRVADAITSAVSELADTVPPGGV
jgi:restriction endonuclease